MTRHHGVVTTARRRLATVEDMRSLVLLVFLATSAYADAPKYTRKQDVRIDVKSTQRTRPIQPVAAPQRPITADLALVIEERTEPLRKEQELILLQLVRDTPDDDADKPDYLFRLAENYARQERLWRMKAIELTMPTH
jgi:hypothetical protein